MASFQLWLARGAWCFLDLAEASESPPARRVAATSAVAATNAAEAHLTMASWEEMDSSTPIDDAYGLSLASRHRTGVQHFGANANAEVLAQHPLDGAA